MEQNPSWEAYRSWAS